MVSFDPWHLTQGSISVLICCWSLSAVVIGLSVLGGSVERENRWRKRSNPIAVAVVQGRILTITGVQITAVCFQSVCQVAKDPADLLGLVIIGDTKGVIVNQQCDVDAMVHVVRTRWGEG